MPRSSSARRVQIASFVSAIALILSGVAMPAVAATPTPSATTPAGASTATPTPTPTATPSPTVTASPSPAPSPTVPLRFTTVPRPTIAGTPGFGKTLTAVPGTWKPAASLTYQWRVNGAAVQGATSRTWRLPASAVGHRVTVTVTGARSGYATTHTTSTPTAAVAASTLRRGSWSIAGERTIGQKLTVKVTGWAPSPVELRYTWLRSGVAIPGAKGATYIPTGTDLGKALSVRVAVLKAGYTTVRLRSKSFSVGLPLTGAPVPTVSGTAAVGKTLRATAGAWTPAPVDLRYQWLRGGRPISGATKPTYLLTPADGGAKIAVRVSGSKRSYTTVQRTSVPVSVPRVLSVPAKVALTGTASVGATLTAGPGSWGPGDVAMSYQWLRDGKAIAGATARTYRLVTSDALADVSVRVTGRKTGYTTVSRTSSAVGVLYAFTSSPVPTLSGTAQAGRVLTAKVGSWKPTSANLRTQWRVDGAPVAGAVGTTWEVPTWAAGRSVTFTVTATQKDYRSVTRTTAALRISWSLGTSVLPGTSLRAGVTITSPDGRHAFGLLGDGNVALTQQQRLVRTSRTTGKLDGLLQFTGDGELVLLDDDDASVWSTRTAGLGATALTLGDDGVLRLLDHEGGEIWTSDLMESAVESTAAAASVPGRYGWAYPIRPKGSFTTYAGHSGDDIAAPTGTPVYAMRGGTVSVREIWITSGCPSWAPNRTKQKEVVIASTIDGTRFVQVYAHLSAFSVKTGQTVKAGQRIGSVGSTGCSTGPHLHTAFTVDGERYALYPRDVLGTASY